MMMKKEQIKIIAYLFISLLLSMLFVWLFGAYINWDYQWITEVPKWNDGDRVGLAFATSMPMIVIMGIFMVSKD